MPMAGDLVTRAMMDSSDFRRGAQSVAADVEKLGQKVNGAGSRMQAGINQGAYALQDFASIMSTGGANSLQRATMAVSNNLQFMMAGLGGTGGAVAMVGVAIGSMLLPKLLESIVGFNDLSEATARSNAALDEMIEKSGRRIEFKATLGKVDSPEDAKKLGEDIDTRMAVAEDAATKYDKQIAFMRKRVGEVRNLAGEFQSGAFGKDPEAVVGKMILSPARALMAMTSLNPQIEAMEAQLEELVAKRRKVVGTIGSLRDERAALKTTDNGADRVQELARAQEQIEARNHRNAALEQAGKDWEAKQQQDIERFQKMGRTPLDVLKEDSSRLGELLREGAITGSDFDKAGAALEKQFAQSQRRGGGGHTDNTALMANSAEAYSAVQSQLLAALDPQKEQLKVAREALATAKRQAQALERVERNTKDNGVGVFNF